MRFKKLSKDQIIISLDRLTRFKPTKEKYLRVFSDILVNNLIEPKYKRNDIENLDFCLISDMVSTIINASLQTNSFDNDINKRIISYLEEYENSVFINDDETQKLLNNNINYLGVLDLITEDNPINLKWLREVITILTDSDIDSAKKQSIELRQSKLLKYPLKKIILAEGITEEILLPAFSRYLGHDFYAEGIQIIAAGGKNQVVKMYYKLSQEVKLPIFVLLDRDAEENIRQIEPRLREIDCIHLVSCGEFEDLLPKSLIIKTVNFHFENFLSINEADLNIDMPTAKILEEIFKTRGLHEFKKAEFAKLVREKITEESDISEEIKSIICEIKRINKNA